MAVYGIVQATGGLWLREEPGGEKIKLLSDRTLVEIVGRNGGWLNIIAGTKRGWSSADYIVLDAEDPISTDPQLPGGDGGFRYDGKHAVAPDGTRFAKKYKLGVFNYGVTSVGAFVRSNATAFPGLSSSMLRVMEAVSVNEGKLEAINTWDSAFLTFGAFQWTAGSQDARGELPALLDLLHREDAPVFETYFGRHGLGFTDTRFPDDYQASGRFTLNGAVLRTHQDKAILRSLPWAYRFWLAGHNDVVRRVQIQYAAWRIHRFYRRPRWAYRGRVIGDWLTSEYAVALLLDQHVNRPGHVAKTVAKAVAALEAEIGVTDPSGWGFAEEKRLIDHYLTIRARTSMTDSQQRADRTRKVIADGNASDERGSFQP